MITTPSQWTHLGKWGFQCRCATRMLGENGEPNASIVCYFPMKLWVPFTASNREIWWLAWPVNLETLCLNLKCIMVDVLLCSPQVMSYLWFNKVDPHYLTGAMHCLRIIVVHLRILHSTCVGQGAGKVLAWRKAHRVVPEPPAFPGGSNSVGRCFF